MSLKRKFINFFLASALAVSGAATPFLQMGALAADSEQLDAPEVAKMLKDNGDGTYTISLSVKGQRKSSESAKKANVVVVLDTSGSMSDFIEGETGPRRLGEAKKAVKSLCEQLLKANSEKNPDMVEIAMIDFSSKINHNYSATTKMQDVNSWLFAAQADGGTNWEAALLAAEEVDFQDEDDTYILFVSDGNPTFRLSSHSLFGWDDPDDGIPTPRGVHGSGKDDRYGWNFGDAKKVADRIIATNGKKLYSIGAFGEATTMKNLGGEYYDAGDSETLNVAFSKIVSEISNTLSLTNIKFTDGLTGQTSTEINGSAGGFKYYRGVLEEGAEVTSLPEWIGAPSAEFSEGTASWDLGDEMIENGETAAVSFIVYPSQEVLDLISDLNNGAEWKSEYETEGVRNNGDGTYSLKTNTPGTKMSYKTVSQTTADGKTTTEVSPEKSVEIINPEPVALYSEKLDVVKIWEDTLDGGAERSEISEVVLDLQRDGKTIISGITLNAEKVDEDQNWTLEDLISIAPGIMVAEGHEAYEGASVKASGKDSAGKAVEYAILEPGHDYEFIEESTDEHFELNNNGFHPMLVDGKLMNVKFERGGDGSISTFTILSEISGRVSATNTLKGGINIRKIVKDNDGKEISPVDLSGNAVKFPISAEVKLKDGTAFSCEYKVYDKDGNASAKKKCAMDGTFSEEISVGELIRVVNVPAGSLYRVSEDEAKLSTGYFLDEVIYEISDGSADDYVKATAEKGYYKVKGNSASRATVVNEYLTGAVKVSKTVEVLSGNREKALGKEFSFTLNLSGKNGESLGVHEFTLKNGGEKLIDQIPAGAKYSVSETEMAGFTASSKGAEGEVAARGTAEAKFKNTYSVLPVEKEISATKLFGWDDEWWRGDEFTFILLDAERQEIQRKSVNSLSKTATFTLKFGDETDGTETYYISEATDGFRGGVSRVETDPDVVWRIRVQDKGDGTLTVEAGARGDKDYIYNEYNTEPVVFGEEGSETEGWLEIEKELEGSETPGEDETFRFIIELAGTDVDEFEFSPESVEIVGAGKTKFSEIMFEKPGEYVFQISEEAGSAEFYSYDPSVYFLDVIVTDNNEGQLVVSGVSLVRAYGATIEEADTVKFTNFYNPISRGEAEEAVIPKTPETGVLSKVVEEYARENGEKIVGARYFEFVIGVASVLALVGAGFGVKALGRKNR